jgi:hypothetical protein
MKPIWFFFHLPKTGGSTFITHLSKYLFFDEQYIDLGELGQYVWDQGKKKEIKPFLEREPEERNKAIVIAVCNASYHIHGLFPNRVPRYITFLRNPPNRVVSIYNHMMTRRESQGEKLIPFEEWYQDQPRNQMTRFYTFKSGCHATTNVNPTQETTKHKTLAHVVPDLESAMRILGKCQYIGFTDNLDSFLATLFTEIQESSGIAIPVGNIERVRVAGETHISAKKIPGNPELIQHKEFLNLNDVHALRAWLEEQNPLDMKLYNAFIRNYR